MPLKHNSSLKTKLNCHILRSTYKSLLHQKGRESSLTGPNIENQIKYKRQRAIEPGCARAWACIIQGAAPYNYVEEYITHSL